MGWSRWMRKVVALNAGISTRQSFWLPQRFFSSILGAEGKTYRGCGRGEEVEMNARPALSLTMPSSRRLPGTEGRNTDLHLPTLLYACTKACNPDVLRPSLVAHVGRRVVHSPIAVPPCKVPEAHLRLPRALMP
ncbi:hypothetical protein IWZ00DRAFT_20868 [Phyllosticta capitalensis]